MAKNEAVSYGPQVKDLHEAQQARSVLVSKIPRLTAENSVMQNRVVRHFECVENGGGKIECIQFPNEETAIITFESCEGSYIPITNGQLHEFYGDKGKITV